MIKLCSQLVFLIISLLQNSIVFSTIKNDANNKSLEIKAESQIELDQNLQEINEYSSEDKQILKILKISTQSYVKTIDNLSKIILLQPFVELTELHLSFYQVGIQNEDIEYVYQALSEMTNLSKLILDFRLNSVQNVDYISKILEYEHLQNLTMLALDFSNNEIISITKLEAPFKKLVKLEQLIFRFGQNISNIDFFSNIFEKLDSLQSLQINLGKQLVQLDMIQKALENKDNLSFLELILQGHQIQDLKPLQKAVDQLKNLNKINIHIINHNCMLNLENILIKKQQIIFEEKSCRQNSNQLENNKTSNSSSEEEDQGVWIVYTLLIGTIMLIFLCGILGYAKRQLDNQKKKSKHIQNNNQSQHKYKEEQSNEVFTHNKEIQSNIISRNDTTN